MDSIDRLVPYYRKFTALPFLARRAIIFALSVLVWIIGGTLMNFHVSPDVCALIVIAGGVGALWSTELWRLWKPLFYIVLVCIAVMK
ncbi:hypothetical protein [Paraburkholderia sp. XV]|uniref:hypothetical protein n=1 Tax=Paraburkholderia sp. XV TaxID=2831520 RepID=UPI001CD26FD8|nr:hypothetical protein [Paraburkholderia sp. XV]